MRPRSAILATCEPWSCRKASIPKVARCSIQRGQNVLEENVHGCCFVESSEGNQRASTCSWILGRRGCQAARHDTDPDCSTLERRACRVVARCAGTRVV